MNQNGVGESAPSQVAEFSQRFHRNSPLLDQLPDE
jgi:hypothetical protein